MTMVNQNQDNRAFKPEFYVLLEEERRKEKAFRERAKKLSQIQQEFLDKADGVEPEVTEEKEKKETKSMTKKKSKMTDKTEDTNNKTTAEKPPEKEKKIVKSDEFNLVRAKKEEICEKCHEKIEKGITHYRTFRFPPKRFHEKCA